MLPTKFQVNWPFGTGEAKKKQKTDFQDGGHLGFPIETIQAIFEQQVTPMLPTKFQVNWLFGSGKEAKNKFSRWLLSWIFNQNDFRYLWSTSYSDASYHTKFQVSWPFGSGEEDKNRFSRLPQDFSYFWSTSVLQKVLSLGSDYFSVTFYQTFLLQTFNVFPLYWNTFL